ncbi:protein Tob1 [Rhipicephalus sanguineus]|uniref:protein Tob1 n=1 Tax=Rhipicephalus sanguineus TaxID=34632 RepID=UPI001892F0D2|nr:protein Tob1 [Rhipicephalus sanguineus]
MHSVADSSEAGAGPGRMQVEIQVALNFLVSFLYNKLPRRRVNQFAEELDRALRRKFRGHWYPEKPYRGSAFRCVKTSPPLDPVFQIAARESGVDLRDVRENLPPDLSIWIDPGEVSYRIGEKGAAQVLLGGPQSSVSESRCCSTSPGSADEALVAQLAGLGLGPGAAMTPLSPGTVAAQSAASAPALAAVAAVAAAAAGPCTNPGAGAPVVNGTGTRSLTFTTASFAQTKFGSTKLKTSSKRAQRLSPTELSLRREQQQQQQHQQQQQQQQHVARGAAAVPTSGNPLSPHDLYGSAAAAAAAALPVDAFGDAAAAVVASQVAAAAAAASCPPPPPTTASRFAAAASPFLAAAAAAGGSLQGHHHHHHHHPHHHHHSAVSGAAAELGAALQQHLLLAN